MTFRAMNHYVVAFAFLLIVSSAAQGAAAIRNPSFEEVDDAGRPRHWNVWINVPGNAGDVCSIVKFADAPHGKRVAQLTPNSPQISIISQNIAGLQPGAWYELSARIRSKDLVGHGARLGVEYWSGSVAYGGIDSEPVTGTTPWRECSLQFQAPAPKYRVQLDFFQCGSSGTVQMDHLRIRKIPAPSFDLNDRRVLEGPFWGMFTCQSKYFLQYGRDMKDTGVYWQRMGLGGATSPEVQTLAQELGMAFASCIDGMPQPRQAGDPCYPVTYFPHFLSFVQPFVEMKQPTIRIWEVFNEPNLRQDWALEGYSNLLNLAGEAIKKINPNVLVGTGGFGLPYTGYVEACLKRDKDKVIDIVLIHPYCVDEGLDTHLWAVTQACRRTGRADVAVAINETGWPTWDPATGYTDYSQFVTEEEQARNIVKMHIQGLAHKLSFITYLGWNDFTEPSDQARNMGLVRVDGSPKPSLTAYKYMTKTLGQTPRMLKQDYQPDGTRVYQLSGQGGKPVWVVWNGLRNAKVAVDTGDVAVLPCDMFGAKKTVTPVTGKIELDVSDEPLYLAPVDSK